MPVRLIDVDITDRADGRLVAWDETGGTHAYVNPTGGVLNNFSATDPPDADNDVDEGYGVGSCWVDVSEDKHYVCVDATDGAAVWIETTGGGGGNVSNAGSAVTLPELTAHNWSGSDVSFAGATAESGVANNALTGTLGRITYPGGSTAGLYVASAIGTGNFDLRARIIAAHTTDSNGSSTAVCTLHFGVTDTSGTANTRLMVRVYVPNPSTSFYYVGLNGSTGAEQAGVIRHVLFPCILRVTRASTTVTYYVSFTEGLTWSKLSSVTSSLDVARLYVQGVSNTGGVTHEAIVHWIRSV